MKTLQIAPAVALTLGLVLTACSPSGASPQSQVSSSGQLTQVDVGVIPVVDVSPVYLGIEQGIFEKHGLDVTATVAQGGAAIVPAVQSGDFDFGFSNATSLIIARSNGLPVKAIAPGPQTTGEEGNDYASIMVSKDSSIASLRDLAGKRVAVNTLNNITDTLLREAMAEAGGDPSSIKFVEVGYPDMPGQLEAGNVDAIFVAEPFQTIAENDEAKIIDSPFVEPVEDLMISMYFTNEALLEEDPDLVDRFADAMTEAQVFADEHPAEARGVLDSYLNLDPQVVGSLVMPTFPSTVNETSTQELIDLADKYGVIESPVTLEDLIHLQK